MVSRSKRLFRFLGFQLELIFQNPLTSGEGIKTFKSHLSSLKRLHYFLNSRKPIQFDLEAILPRFKKLTALSIPTTAYSKRILGSLPPTLLYLELVQQSTWIPYKTLVQTCPVRSSPNAPYLAELSLVANEREHHKVGTESSFGPLRSMLLRRAPPIGLQEFFRTKTVSFFEIFCITIVDILISRISKVYVKISRQMLRSVVK